MRIEKLVKGRIYRHLTDKNARYEFTGEFQEVANMYECGKRPIFIMSFPDIQGAEPFKSYPTITSVEEYIYDPEYTYEKECRQDWEQAMKLMNLGHVVKVDEAFYWEMLNVLPPNRMSGDYFEVGEPDSHDSQGRPVFKCFWKHNGEYFGARNNSQNLPWKKQQTA